MVSENARSSNGEIRIGAVAYLNARPLVYSLADFLPDAKIVVDLPSRLADSLADGRLDVAMIPSIEYARGANYSIISDACIACDGAVRSVKLYSRVPIERLRSLALDEGSRTSVALTKILLRERFGVSPVTQPLPIGASADDAPTDAVLLIGDRGMLPAQKLFRTEFEFEWDLGEEWTNWTGLPFVFAVWIARRDADLQGISAALSAARDDGILRFEEIAEQASASVGLPSGDCLSYLRDHLEFHFGARQRQGLQRFYELAGRNNLAPEGVQLEFHRHS